MFKCAQKYKIKSFQLYFKRSKFQGVTILPLKMNLILEIWKMVIKEIQILHLWILLYFAYLLTILQVTCQTNSKILKGTPNNTQVTPITRPPFLLSPQYQFFFLKYPHSDENSLLYWSEGNSSTNLQNMNDSG